MKAETDLAKIFKDDGMSKLDLTTFANRPVSGFREVRNTLGDGSWAARIAFNERFGGVLIQQQPGESNRLHYHPDSDECWVIMDGVLEWTVAGIGKRIVSQGDIVVVRAGIRHLIKCIGDKPAVRFAITKPDVGHVYVEEEDV